jgi:hypothetical protein
MIVVYTKSSICTIIRNLVGILVYSVYSRVLLTLEQYPTLFHLRGSVLAIMQDVFTRMLKVYIFSYAIINELYVFIVS